MKPDFSDQALDPFWDEPEPALIGKSFLLLNMLASMMEYDDETPILSTENKGSPNVGKLKIAYIPCDNTGEGEPDEDLFVADSNELLNREIFFRLEVTCATGLPPDLTHDVFITYRFEFDPETVHRVPFCQGQNESPVFNYKKVHRIANVTEHIL